MNQISLLRPTLKPHLGWHGARLSFLALFLIALLRVKTVNLTELATGFRSKARIDSSHKRLQRFFPSFDLDYTAIARAVIGIMELPQPWVLSVDRTEWSFGTTRFNILMLGVIHHGVAYPVVWKMLDKKAEATPRIFNALGNAPQAGNSHGDERMALLDQFYNVFPEADVAYLAGEREFVGKHWLTYLLIEPTIPFRLRIRKSDRLKNFARNLGCLRQNWDYFELIEQLFRVRS